MRSVTGQLARRMSSRLTRPAPLLLLLFILMLAVTAAPALAQSSNSDAQSAYNKRDFNTAFKIAHALAAEADVDAQYLLGVLYENSEGVKHDTAAAATFLI